MVPQMKAQVFNIWNSRYNCNQIGLYEVLKNRMLALFFFFFLLFGACLLQILSSCNFSHEQVCFQQQLFTYNCVGISENCGTLYTAGGLEPASGAWLGWSVCSVLWIMQLGLKQNVFQTFISIRERRMIKGQKSHFHQDPWIQFFNPFPSVIQCSGISLGINSE